MSETDWVRFIIVVVVGVARYKFLQRTVYFGHNSTLIVDRIVQKLIKIYSCFDIRVDKQLAMEQLGAGARVPSVNGRYIECVDFNLANTC